MLVNDVPLVATWFMEGHGELYYKVHKLCMIKKIKQEISCGAFHQHQWKIVLSYYDHILPNRMVRIPPFFHEVPSLFG